MIVTDCPSRIVSLSRAPVVSIVDDDDSVRAAMSSLVRSLGYEACLFASAEAFLASPHLNATSCLIADIQMPGMSGLELQNELHARQRDIPIIFITAFAEERIRKRAEAAAAPGLIQKRRRSHDVTAVPRPTLNQITTPHQRGR